MQTKNAVRVTTERQIQYTEQRAFFSFGLSCEHVRGFRISICQLRLLKGNCHEQFNLKKTAWTFQVWFKAASIEGKTARIWRAFGGERDNSRQKSRFREQKVTRKPGMLPQTNLLKCMRSSWQFPFNYICWIPYKMHVHIILLKY